MTNEQRSNDLMPLMRRGSETDFLALQLADAIAVASNPANGPKVYRVARREAGELARKIYRTAVALAFREQLIASAAQGYAKTDWSQGATDAFYAKTKYYGE